MPNKNAFNNAAAEFVYMRTYSRWRDDLGRREYWGDSVQRYFDFFKKKFGDKVPKKVFEKCQEAVLSKNVAPSMRAFWAAGDALEKNHITAYNCSYLPFDSLKAPVDMFMILMSGSGAGFSVENQYVEKLPEVKLFSNVHLGVFIVEDSREGWCDSLNAGIEAWFDGRDISFDYSKIRPMGARLKTMGGRASGPEPLKKLHTKVRRIILDAQGRKLTSVECLDIGNRIAEAVVVGGVRRSSQIVFSDLNDEKMCHAKDAPTPPHRFMANHTVPYLGRPNMITFMREWTALAASGTGERGIFNVKAAMESAPRREPSEHFRTNPCGEISLLPHEFCNLTSVVVRPTDTFSSLCEKVISATWLGAMQACLTDFPYIDPKFKKNCKKERLLGVSLGGIMDNPRLITPDRLQDLREIAIKTAKKAAKLLDINTPVAITTCKPDGTLSQVYDSAPGCHTRYDKFYIRRYRISATDPLYRMMKDQGVVFTPENGQGPESVDAKRQKLVDAGRTKAEAKVLVADWDESQVMTWVCSFPVASPKGCLTRNDMTAIEQLEHYLMLKKNWAEHSISRTVYVKKDEWLQVGSFVYDHFDEINGLSFFPYDESESTYQQAPYESITEAEYNKLIKAFPVIDYTQLSKYEQEDQTTGAKSLACSAGNCELN